MKKAGILLLNLGTPKSPSLWHVGSYLKEFLNDPRVIDLPFWIRWPLVNLGIIPFRSRKTAKAYRTIWSEQGSPLLVHNQKLTKALSEVLKGEYEVALGMRYGSPTIAEALAELRDCTQLIVIPLYPQYSSAATGSVLEQFLKAVSTQTLIPHLTVIQDFYNHPLFIKAYAHHIQEKLSSNPGHLILSYHGLPVRQVEKSGCLSACHAAPTCLSNEVPYCYRAQCYETARLLAAQLNLSSAQYTVSFQSRLGRTPWIKPYTDTLLVELASQGIKNIVIASPSFVTDCLETLEEIDLRARLQWQQLGGESFTFIPALNSSSVWIEALAGIIQDKGFLGC